MFLLEWGKGPRTHASCDWFDLQKAHIFSKLVVKKKAAIVYSEAKRIKDTGCAKKGTHLCNSFIESPDTIVDDPFILGHSSLFWLYCCILASHVDGIADLGISCHQGGLRSCSGLRIHRCRHTDIAAVSLWQWIWIVDIEESGKHSIVFIMYRIAAKVQNLCWSSY